MRKYLKLKNHYAIDYNRIKDFLNEKFIILEKIHGANFSFIYDEGEYFVAKRNGVIDKSDNFFNSNLIYDKYIKEFKKLVEDILKENIGVKYIQLYGELFGGRYIIDGKIIEKGKLVQKEILYCPYNEFFVYDILVDDKFLSYKDFKELVSKYNFHIVPELGIMNLEDALLFDVENVPTKVPIMLGLPSIENNFIEGVVIRGYEKDYYNYGQRIIIKKKSKKFVEKKHNEKKEYSEKIDENLIEIYKEIENYWNLNRWIAYFSKVGEDFIKIENIKKITSDIVKDIFDDIVKDMDIENISKKNMKQIRTFLFGKIIRDIKKIIINQKLIFENEKEFSNFFMEKDKNEKE